MWIRLGEILVREHCLSSERLKDVLRYQRLEGGWLGSLLVSLGLVSEARVARALSLQHGVPGICLSKSSVPEEVLARVPQALRQAHRVLPIELAGDAVRLAVFDPADRRALGEIARDARTRILPVVSVRCQLEAAIRRAEQTGNRGGAPPPRWILPSEPAILRREEAAPPLISRRDLFGHAGASDASMSPDGQMVSFIGEWHGGRAIYIASVDTPLETTRVVDDGELSLRWHWWAYNGRHIIYGGDVCGNEKQQVRSVDVRTKRVRRLSSRQSLNEDVRVLSLGRPDADEVLIESTRPGRALEIRRVSLLSGKQARVEGMAPDVERYWADGEGRLRLCRRYEGNRQTLYARTGSGWRRLFDLDARARRATEVVTVGFSGRYAFLLDGAKHAFAHLVRVDLETNDEEIVATPKHADIEEAIIYGDEVKAVVEYHPRRTLRVFCPEMQREMAYLGSKTGGTPDIVGCSADHSRWLVRAETDRRPPRYFLYDRKTPRLKLLFDARPELRSHRFETMRPVNVPARDGLSLPCYLTEPCWVQGDGPRPTVILLHGGPTARDYWGFDEEHQWLANRGYAVLSVNYRGSTGFGKRLRKATPHWIAPEMVQDVEDATRWAIDRGIADAERIGIMGASYGGYLVLQGLACTPELYACGVDLFGVSNWRSLVDDRYAASEFGLDLEGARALLEARSPLFHAHAIRKPLLVAQGTTDPRVPQSQSFEMTQALVSHGRAVTYLVYDREGHGFYRQPNRLSYYAIVEAFLAQHLGGRLESYGTDLDNANLRIAAGAEHVTGLDAFWKASQVIECAAEAGSRELSLSHRGLRELPPSIRRLRQLRRLDLSGNALTSLPPEIGELAKLERLDLGSNQLMILPEELGALERLWALDLSNNQLHELPRTLRDIQTLRNLDIRGNALREGALWGFRGHVFKTSRAGTGK